MAEPDRRDPSPDRGQYVREAAIFVSTSVAGLFRGLPPSRPSSPTSANGAIAEVVGMLSTGMTNQR